MRVLPAGESALLIEVPDLDAVLALSAALRAQPIDGVLEIVPAAQTILLLCEPKQTTLESIAAAVSRIEPSAQTTMDGDEVEIAATYDGPDIEVAAAALGGSVRDLIDWHTGTEWQVAFCGFAPGFGYLVTDDARSIPRRDTPRTSVPAGSIGLAGEFSGVYPRASPGGWQLIGHTRMALFDLDADPPAALAPGGRVRFVERS